MCWYRCVRGQETCWRVRASVTEPFTCSVSASRRLPKENSSVLNATRVGRPRVWLRPGGNLSLVIRSVEIRGIFGWFQVTTHALCARRLVMGQSAARFHCAGSSTTQTAYWDTRPPSLITKASAAPCMCVCPATSASVSTSALKVRST